VRLWHRKWVWIAKRTFDIFCQNFPFSSKANV
jgi:hypothetical protein